MLYTKPVRCGNLIARQEQMNPMVFWWGMKKVSRVGNHGEGNLEDSWRTNTLPMPTGHAPPKHHGVFLLALDRQGALADGPVWAAPNKHRALYTPKITRQACQRGTWVDAVKRVVDQHCIGWNRCLMGLLEGSIKWPYRAGMVRLPPLGDYCLET
jgi:hypothetical protein